MHATAEVPPLGNGTGDKQADERRVVNAALIVGPVGSGLDGVRPELKHAGSNEPEQHQREEGDVVDAVFGFHPWDEGRAPRAVFPRGIHA